MADLGSLGGDYSSVSALNNNGVVVGESSVTNGDTHAFIYTGGQMTDIGTFGGTYSTAYAANHAGQGTGVANTANDAQTHGFLYARGTLTPLGTRRPEYLPPPPSQNTRPV